MTYKLELKSCHEVIYTVSVADVDSIFYGRPIGPDLLTVVMKNGKRLYCDEVCPIDTLEEKESASEELEEAAKKHAKCQREDDLECGYDLTKLESFIAGAQWREDQMMKKAVDADCFGFHGAALFSFRLPSGNYLVGSKVKVIVIKQD